MTIGFVGLIAGSRSLRSAISPTNPMTIVMSKLVQTVVVITIVATITFFLMHAAPGDPFAAALENPNVSESVRTQWREAYGLDKPVAEQYVRYLANVARGELGWSFSKQRPVRNVLLEAMPNTLLLMVIALPLSFVLGILMGIYQTMKNGSWKEKTLSGISLFIYSLPDFWLALMVMLVFAYWMQAFPVSGTINPAIHEFMNPMEKLIDRIHHLVLPVSVLTLLSAAGIARYQRAELLKVVNQDFVRTAQAKGLSRKQAIMRHALRNALIPMITRIGLFFPLLITGAVFVEKIFSWPGMGYTIVNAISTRDYPLVMAGVIAGSLMVVIGNLIADLLYSIADPRIRAN